MFFGKINGEFVDDVSGVPTQSTEEGTIPIHNDEAELLIRLKELAQCLGVKFVIAQVQRGIDGLERLKIDIDSPLFPL